MTERAAESSAEVVVDLNEKKPIKVLHVDDEPSLLKIAKQCLEMQGPFQVDTASSVEEALEKLKKETYDAVISDYKMPSKDGLELLKELRQGGNNIPFVMFTGKGREEVAIKALNFGADQYINKTGDPETVYCELEHALRRTVERKKAETALETLGEKYRRLFESAIDGVLINGSDGKISSVNRAAVNILGYGSPKDLIGKPAVELYANPEVRARLLQELVEKGYVKERELTWKKRDDALIEILASITVQKDEKGKMLRTEEIIRDVTERKKVEEEIGRFSVAVRMSLDGILTGDLNGNIADVNDAALRMYGGTDKRDMIGKNVLDFVVESDRTRALQDSMESMKTGQGKTIEYRALAKNGTEIPVEITTAFIRDEQGEPIGFVDIIRNIAERKKAELALKESEARYRSLVEQSLAGIIIAQGPAVHGVLVNRAMTNIWGYTAEEFYSMSPQQIEKMIHPEDRSLFFKSFKDRLEGKNVPPHYEFRALRKDGNVIWLEISAGLIEYDGRPAVQGIFSDITERKKAELELQMSERKFRELADQLPVIVYEIDCKGKFTFVNEKGRELTGYSQEDIEKGLSILQTVADEDQSKARTRIQRALGGERTDYSEYTVIKKDGSTFPAIACVSVIVREGKTVGLRGTVIDITERKKMEEKLQDSEEKFRNLAEQSPNMIFINQKGRVVYANKNAEDVMGYKKEELYSPDFNFLDLIAPESRELVNSAFSNHVRGEDVAPYDYKLVTKKGRTIDAILTTRLIIYEGEPAILGTIIDITERKKTEQTLKESEEKYRDLVELAPDGIVAVNVEGIITSTNRSFLKLLGYDSAEETFGKPFTELMTMRMEDIPKFQGMFESLMNGESPSPSEFLYVRRDGASRWAEVHPGVLIRDGHPVGVQAIMRDITERKNAEKLNQENQQKFEQLFMSNPEAAVYVDPNERVLNINPRFTELFGYSFDEVKEKFLDDFVVPEDRKQEALMLAQKGKEGYVYHETVRKNKEGSLIPVALSSAPIVLQDQHLGDIVLYKDITEVKRAQEESEESRKHFQMLFDLMADPVAVVDGRGKILEVTQKAEEITGFKREELVGKNLLKVKMFGAKTKSVMITKLAERMMGMHVEPYEVELVKKDGGKLMYEINATKIDYKGKPADLVVFRDILERKNLEEKLRVVGSLTRHDVRNKLSVVTGNAYLLKRKLAGNPEALEQLADMENAVRNVESIFEFARTYEKLGVEQLVNMNVGKAVDEAVSLFSDLKGVRIVNECGGLTVLADSLLRQLFYDLIDDSLKYGEKLTQIRVRYERSEDKLKLVYEDDGVGISKDNKGKLFNEGFTTGKSSGYGLYLIRRMMDVYGWTISETGGHGKGAQFTISIPKTKSDGRQNFGQA